MGAMSSPLSRLKSIVSSTKHLHVVLVLTHRHPSPFHRIIACTEPIPLALLSLGDIDQQEVRRQSIARAGLVWKFFPG